MTSPHDGRYPGPYARESRGGGGPPPPPPQRGYDPYGAPRPPRERSSPFAPPPTAPSRRPQQVLIAVGLLALSALPWLAFGLAFSLLPLNVRGVIDAGTLAGSPLAGYTAEDIAAAVRVVAVISAVVSVGYLVLVGLTYGRHNWARILVTVLTGVFAALLLVVLVQTLSPIVGLLVVPVAGAALLFTRPVSAWFAG